MHDLNTMFEGVHSTWWTDREATIEEASRSFDGLSTMPILYKTIQLSEPCDEMTLFKRIIKANAEAIAAAFNVQPVSLGHVASIVHPWGTVDDSDGEPTQPLEDPAQPSLRPLAQVLTPDKSNCWATNGLFDVVQTDLGTFHLYTGRAWLYCASNIDPDLKGWMERRLNQRVYEDFSRYANPVTALLYDVNAPMWHEMEAPKND